MGIVPGIVLLFLAYWVFKVWNQHEFNVEVDVEEDAFCEFYQTMTDTGLFQRMGINRPPFDGTWKRKEGKRKFWR